MTEFDKVPSHKWKVDIDFGVIAQTVLNLSGGGGGLGHEPNKNKGPETSISTDLLISAR